jgi:hypothetical protein
MSTGFGQEFLATLLATHSLRLGERASAGVIQLLDLLYYFTITW